MVGAAEFYDGLAPHYDVLFEDWWTAATWHGSVVAGLLQGAGVHPPAAVLDCTCGIGTQALPLAAVGYAVTATDVSPAAVARARHEAGNRGIAAAFGVADVRSVRGAVAGDFAAVVSCDNALPHLLTDDDLLRALREIRACLVPGGLFLATMRDYDALAATRPPGVPVAVHGPLGARHASGQAWVWSQDGDSVDITLFAMAESGQAWSTTTHETTYRALRRQVVSDALRHAGFDAVTWLAPDESGYYQPVVMARASRA